MLRQSAPPRESRQWSDRHFHPREWIGQRAVWRRRRARPGRPYLIQSDQSESRSKAGQALYGETYRPGAAGEAAASQTAAVATVPRETAALRPAVAAAKTP